MKSAVLAVAACCIFAAAAGAAEPAAPAAAVVAPTTPATLAAVAPEQQTPPMALPPLTPAPPVMYAPPVTSTGSLLQTILALSFVLALLAALAWAMKRYGPKSGGTNAALRLVGALSLGGRERILIIEVADQWIVVGAAPGRVNALAVMPRQPGSDSSATLVQGASGANFAQWLKQTRDKRHGQ